MVASSFNQNGVFVGELLGQPGIFELATHIGGLYRYTVTCKIRGLCSS